MVGDIVLVTCMVVGSLFSNSHTLFNRLQIEASICVVLTGDALTTGKGIAIGFVFICLI